MKILILRIITLMLIWNFAYASSGARLKMQQLREAAARQQNEEALRIELEQTLREKAALERRTVELEAERLSSTASTSSMASLNSAASGGSMSSFTSMGTNSSNASPFDLSGLDLRGFTDEQIEQVRQALDMAAAQAKADEIRAQNQGSATDDGGGQAGGGGAANPDAPCSEADWNTLVAGWNPAPPYDASITNADMVILLRMRRMGQGEGPIQQKILKMIAENQAKANLSCSEADWNRLVDGWGPPVPAYDSGITHEQMVTLLKMKRMNQGEGPIRQRILKMIAENQAKVQTQANAPSRGPRRAAAAAPAPVNRKPEYIPKTIAALEEKQDSLVDLRVDKKLAEFAQLFDTFPPDEQAQIFPMLDIPDKEILYRAWGELGIVRRVRSMFLLNYKVYNELFARLLQISDEFLNVLINVLGGNPNLYNDPNSVINQEVVKDMSDLRDRINSIDPRLLSLQLKGILTKMGISAVVSASAAGGVSKAALTPPPTKPNASYPIETEWAGITEIVDGIPVEIVGLKKYYRRYPSMVNDPSAAPLVHIRDHVRTVENFLMEALKRKRAGDARAADGEPTLEWSQEKKDSIKTLQDKLKATNVYEEIQGDPTTPLCKRKDEALDDPDSVVPVRVTPFTPQKRSAVGGGGSTATPNAAVTAAGGGSGSGVTPTVKKWPTPVTYNNGKRN